MDLPRTSQQHHRSRRPIRPIRLSSRSVEKSAAEAMGTEAEGGLTAPIQAWDLDQETTGSTRPLAGPPPHDRGRPVSRVHASAEGAFPPAVFVDALTDFGPGRSQALGQQQRRPARRPRPRRHLGRRHRRHRRRRHLAAIPLRLGRPRPDPPHRHRQQRLRRRKLLGVPAHPAERRQPHPHRPDDQPHPHHTQGQAVRPDPQG